MNTMTIDQALQLATTHHQAGRLAESEALYRQVLTVQPQNPDALHLLGIIANQTGHPDAAIELISRAIKAKADEVTYHFALGDVYSAGGRLDKAIPCYERAQRLRPDLAETHYNLGLALQRQGRLTEAIACYQRSLTLRPDFAEAHNNMGNIFASEDRLAEAEAAFQRALQLRPDYAEAHYNLGKALRYQGRLAEAIDCYQRTLTLRPDFAEAYNNLGNALADQARLDEAITSFKQALQLKPDYPEAHINLGEVYRTLGQQDEARACCERALALRPGFAEAYNNIGAAWKDQGKLDEAIASCREALKLKPDYPEAYNNLGTALASQGNIEEAISYYQRLVGLRPGSPTFHSILLFARHLHPGSDESALRAAHQQWDQQHGVPRRQFVHPHTNSPDPDRRLRIGYVSPDMREHPVTRFLLPLLQNHDHSQFEVTCYADIARADTMTQRLRHGADHWRMTAGFFEEQLAAQIRADEIDILVDLALHTAANRLPVFARKPAPVQVTYLAYPGTSGLSAMDYRLTDPFLDPPGTGDEAYTETSVRLPSYWCYQAPEAAPPVAAPPALSADHITFGCLNNFAKVNNRVQALWIRLMRTVPNARLVLHASEGSHRERVRELMAREEVAPGRLTFLSHAPMAEYFSQYEQIDIALDTFPYAGGTTTCDALWMGVPVVTLVGQTAVGRGGLSILSNIGLTQLVAYNEDEYIRIAVDLAKDLPRLTELRRTLRERMLASPLMDAPRFARSIEGAYRTMWRHWCEAQGTGVQP